MNQIEELIHRIAALQITDDHPFYSKGLFPSQRFHPHLPFQREDNNIFFTVLIVQRLQQFMELLPQSAQPVAQEIIRLAKNNFPKYQSKYGLKTYNFYETFPPNHFPNGWFSWFRHFEAPDDADDTALIYLCNQPTKQELEWLQKKLNKHANSEQFPIRNTFPKYRQLKAYSVWFGKKMPIEFDVCVLCNVLSLHARFGLKWDRHANDSLQFIREVILNGEYMDRAFYVSHYYPKTPLILYQLARFLGQYPLEEMAECRPVLLKDIRHLLSGKVSEMEKLILSNALMWLGEKEPVPLTGQLPADTNSFWYFSASLLKPLDNYPLGKPSKLTLFHLKWKSVAFNLSLWLEHLILQNDQKARWTLDNQGKNPVILHDV